MTVTTGKTATKLSDDALDGVTGGAETVHFYLKSNGEKVDGEATAAEGARDNREVFVRTTIRE